MFGGMRAFQLKGKTEQGWEKFVKEQGGNPGLVSGWLEEHNLWRFLKGEAELQVQDTPQKKTRDGESSSPAGEVPNLYDALAACRLTAGDLVTAPNGFDWPCG